MYSSQEMCNLDVVLLLKIEKGLLDTEAQQRTDCLMTSVYPHLILLDEFIETTTS